MNHKFINALCDLYKEIPQDKPELAARTVAVLLDGIIEELEGKGIQITSESLLKKIQESLEEHKRAA